MRRLAMVTLGLVLLSGAARVDGQTGNDLLADCKAADSEVVRKGTEASAGLCMGYISGVVDMGDFTRAYFAPVFCEPHGVTMGQLNKVLLKYLNNHPERLHEHKLTLTVDAFKEAFPCKAPKP